jgi:cytochrome c biogenesis protein CcmG/thiol:disulfide interchange protein DsbE
MVFVVLAIFLLNGLERDPNAMPSALIDRPVPVFSLPVLGDETRSVTEVLFQGEPALLNVWATWCVACRIEHPFLNKLADQGIRIIGLNYKDDNAAARKWLMDKGDPYA